MVPLTKLPSHLPDLCLLNIFKRVPLCDLLFSVRMVCINWHRVAPTEFKRRRTIVLIQDYNTDVEMIRNNENPFGSDLIEHVLREDGSPWAQLRSHDQICFDSLLVPDGVLAQAFTFALIDTLPNVTHLTVVQSNVPLNLITTVLSQLVRLLNNYGTRLVSLQLYVPYFYDLTYVTRAELVTHCTDLLDSINRLPSLRQLTFNVNLTFFNLSGEPKLSILSRLDTFTSNVRYVNVPNAWLIDSIRQHATGNIRIEWEPYLPIEQLLALGQLASKFSAAEISTWLNVAHYNNMRHFGSHFSTISRLTLSIRNMPMSMLARCLSSQTELVHLKIDVASQVSEELPEPEYVPVPSVRLLSLRMLQIRSHLHTETLHLAQIFPNLQVLSFDQHIEYCDECEYYAEEVVDFGFDEEWLDRVEQCLRLARQPFRLCAQLHTVKFRGNFQYLFPNNLINRDQL